MDPLPVKDVLKSALTEHGEQFVVEATVGIIDLIPGTLKMLKLCVVNLDINKMVSIPLNS